MCCAFLRKKGPYTSMGGGLYEDFMFNPPENVVIDDSVYDVYVIGAYIFGCSKRKSPTKCCCEHYGGMWTPGKNKMVLLTYKLFGNTQVV